MMNQDLWVFQYVPFDVFSMFILKEEFSNLVVCIILYQFSFIKCCFGGKKCSRLFALVRYCSRPIMGSIFVNIFNAIPICFWVSCLIVSLCLGYPLILVFFPAYNHFNFRCSNFILFFWFVLMVTIYIDFLDTLVRQAAMAFKCLLLIYYKNGRGHNFRRQVLVASFLFLTDKIAYIFQVQFPPTII